MQRRHLAARRHSGFTLIELLLVIGIIIVLLSLIVGAAMKGAAWIYQRNAETTFDKVLQRLNRHYATIISDAQAWETPDAILTQANGDTKRADILKLKYLYKWSFPMNFAEAQENYVQSRNLYRLGSGYPLATSLYQRLLQNLQTQTGGLTSTSLTAAQQNAACLLAAFELTRGSSQDELTSEEVDQQIRNFALPAGTTFDNNRWLRDPWGSPVVFLRYGNMDPTPALWAAVAPMTFNATHTQWLTTRAQKVFQIKQGADPEDSGPVLGRVNWYNFQNGAAWGFAPVTLNRVGFRAIFRYDIVPGAPLPPTNPIVDPWPSVYAPFVMFSAGPDRNYDTTYDNLDSYGLRTTIADNK